MTQRPLEVQSSAIPQSAGRPALEPVRLQGREGVNSLFEYELLLKTPDALNLGASQAADFNLDDFIGREISCLIQLDGAGQFTPGAVGASTDHLGAGTRQINALITDASLWGEEGRHVQYRLVLRPWLHLATLSTDCKIFQNKTAIDILDELLADYPFPVDKRLIETYPARDYQTQFNESDFEFFERLTQEWGINYFFEHSDGAHRLVLIDNIGGFKPVASAAYQQVDYHAPGWKVDGEYIHRFAPHSQLTSGRYAAREYDYTRPKADLSVQRSDPRPTGQAGGEVYHWHSAQGGAQASAAGSHYAQPKAGSAEGNDPAAEGSQLALLRMQALRTHGARAKASGNLRGMSAGATFALQNHPRASANAQYLLLDTEFLIEDIAQDSQIIDAAADRKQQWRVQVDFTAHPLTEPLRPQPTQPKPRTQGPQVALVVGPAGENLWTDELGRIKVQFPWDRLGQKNQHSSCWLRVASPWAGNQLGGISLPRIGQEVIVDFIGGDPDLPICSGRVHNQLNLPPWSLPGQSALSGWRSRELTKEGGNASGGRSNHLVFDDTDQKIQTQLKSDHQSSSLSLGRIARIEDNAGRKDLRGEGFELRSDGHGAIRAKQGLLITTEARDNARAHLLDSAETLQRLTQARELHESGAELAQKNKAQEASDQTEVVKALKEQNDAIKGSGKVNAETGEFPELNAPHLVLASPAGIETTSQFSTHIASVEHTAITSGKHTSLTSGDSLLVTAMEAIKLFAAQKGMKLVAAQADIEIEALKTCIHMVAKDQITLKADKIRIEATNELLINGGGSYTRYQGGSVESGTTGAHTRHAGNHSLTGPDSQGRPSLPSGLKPGKGQLEIFHRYANDQGFKGAGYEVTDVAGQIKRGALDDKGFAAVSGLAPGGAIVKLDKDPRNPWDASSYIGKPTWPPQAEAEAAVAGSAAPKQDLMAGVMKQAAGGLSGAAGNAMKTGLAGGDVGKALGGDLTGMAKGLATGAATGALTAAIGGAVGGAGGGPAAGIIGGLAGGAISGNLASAAQGLATGAVAGAVGQAASGALGHLASPVVAAGAAVGTTVGTIQAGASAAGVSLPSLPPGIKPPPPKTS